MWLHTVEDPNSFRTSLLSEHDSRLSKKKILLSIYCSEITHAIHTAEKTAVLVHEIRHGTEVRNWRNNPNLLAACNSAKFWLHLWVDYGKPRSRVVSTLFVFTWNVNFSKPSHSIRLTKLPVPARLSIILLLLYGIFDLRINLPVARPACQKKTGATTSETNFQPLIPI